MLHPAEPPAKPPLAPAAPGAAALPPAAAAAAQQRRRLPQPPPPAAPAPGEAAPPPLWLPPCKLQQPEQRQRVAEGSAAGEVGSPQTRRVQPPAPLGGHPGVRALGGHPFRRPRARNGLRTRTQQSTNTARRGVPCNEAGRRRRLCQYNHVGTVLVRAKHMCMPPLPHRDVLCGSSLTCSHSCELCSTPAHCSTNQLSGDGGSASLFPAACACLEVSRSDGCLSMVPRAGAIGAQGQWMAVIT